MPSSCINTAEIEEHTHSPSGCINMVPVNLTRNLSANLNSWTINKYKICLVTKIIQ